jgi:Fe2+ transport system protein FeoA
MTLLDKCFRHHKRHRHGWKRALLQGPLCLKDVLPGHFARVAGFSPRLSPERRTQLRAYGLVPGYRIRVLQHNPVSVIQVEHSEIALEQELAGEIFVSEVQD